MSKIKFKKGPQLFSLARKKALSLGIPQDKGVRMADLICRIQICEGYTPCFQQQKVCSENSCCWQASCKAVMSRD